MPVKNAWVNDRAPRAGAIFLVVALAIAAPARTADGVPTISPRGYVGGSAKVTVTGSFKINADIPINRQASMSDGEMTWLQYGVSGAAEPNMLLTVSSYEVGFGVARGKATATAGAENCTGDMVVGPQQVHGKYSCKGVTSYDPSTGQMGTVDIEIQFVATS
jgi:hypothetical protein